MHDHSLKTFTKCTLVYGYTIRFRQREEGGEDTEEADEEAVEVSNGDIEEEINPNRIVVKYSLFVYGRGGAS